MTSTRPALLLTRPRDAAERFAAELRLEIELETVVIAPVLDIVTTGATPDLDEVDGVIFSSSNAVASIAAGQGVFAWCVGPATTEKARARGFDARMAGKNAEELIEQLAKLRPSGALRHLRGEHSRGAIAERLNRAGLQVDERILYKQHAVPLTKQAQNLLNGERPVILPLFSPRSARLFFEQAKIRAPLWVVSISEEVARIADGFRPSRRIVVDRPEGAAMCAAIVGICRGTPPVEGPQGNA